MERKKHQEIRVGLFVFVSLFIGMVTIFFFGGGRSLFESSYHLKSKFKEVSGLREGSAVYLAGIQIGTVGKVDIADSADGKNVEVVFNLEKKYQEKIREDSRIYIATQGLLGDKAAFIDMGTTKTAALPNWAYLQQKDVFSFDQLADNGKELIEEVKGLASNLSTLVTDIRTKESLIHSFIYNPDGEEILRNIAHVTKRTDEILHDVKHGSGLIHQLVYQDVDPKVSKTIIGTIDNFKTVSENIKQLTTSIAKGEGSIGGLLKDPTVYYDLKTLLGNANRSGLIKAIIRYTMSKNEKETLK